MIASFSHLFVAVDGLTRVRDTKFVDISLEMRCLDKLSDTLINVLVGVILGVNADTLSDVEITLGPAPVIDL